MITRLLIALAAVPSARAQPAPPPLPTNQRSDQYGSREEFLGRAAAFEVLRLKRMPWQSEAEKDFFRREAFTALLGPASGLKFIRVHRSYYAEGIAPALVEEVLAVPNRNGDMRRWTSMFDTARRGRVEVPYDYFLSETLVTNAMFDVFVRETGYRTCVERYGTGWVVDPTAHWRQGFANDWREQASPGSEPDHPVVQVSWFDAMAFAEWLSLKTGLIFRVPTKEEWRLAARPPAMKETPCLFPWGNSLAGINKRMNFGTGELKGYAWVHDRYFDGYAYSSPVKAFPPTASGFYDMLGNVWTWNWTNASHDEGRPDGDRVARAESLAQLGADRNEKMSMQGGCYLARLSHANLVSKMAHPALDGAEDIGFRLVAVRRADCGL